MGTQGGRGFCGCVEQIGRSVRGLSSLTAVSLTPIPPVERFTPWQIIVSTLTGVYAVRNIDKILGLGCKPIRPFAG